jgi:molybdopterin/thiamine biosynthesis adenylyltransferase
MYAAENARFAENINVPKDVFTKPRIALELPPQAIAMPDVAAAFMFAANILTRLFAHVSLCAPTLAVGPNAWGIPQLPDLLDQLSKVSEGNVFWGLYGAPDIVIGVGAAPTIPAPHRTFFSFSGWEAGLEVELPNSHRGPLGALFAACYGTAQAFVHAARMAGADYRPMAPFRLSLLNYSDVGPPLPCPAEVDLRETHLVGVGAIGSALVYALSHFPTLRGVLHAIDDDSVDGTNLGRYLLMRRSDSRPRGVGDSRGKAKVDVAAHALSGHDIDVRPHEMNFADYRSRHDAPIDLLLTPVDSEAGRRKLAASLPRVILNAATGHTKITISRHGFADGKACLRCLYLPAPGDLTTEKRLATDLGLSIQEVEEHLADNRPIDAVTLARIEKHRGVAPGTLTAHLGQHIQSLYQRVVCGEAAITTAAGTVISPLSFISGAAGVMLAAELVKARSAEFLPYLLDNHFRIDAMMNPNPEFKSVKKQDPTGRCICCDQDYVAIYRQRFSNPAIP